MDRNDYDKIIVSIIVPVYNAQFYITDCISSIFKLKGCKFEVIVVDDGSTDSSLEVLHDLKKIYKNMEIIEQENSGPGSARNAGIERANGKYIYCMDSDDIVLPNMLEECLPVIEKTGCDILGFQAEIFGEIDGRDKKQYIYNNRCEDMCKEIDGGDFIKKYHRAIPMLNTPLMIFRKEFLVENSIKYPEKILHEDNEFYYRLMSFRPKLFLLDKTFYRRRYRANSIMTSLAFEKRLYDQFTVDINIGLMDVCEDMRDVYISDSIRDMLRLVKIFDDNNIKIEKSCIKKIRAYINLVLENEKINLLTLCFITIINRYLNDKGAEDEKCNNILKSRIVNYYTYLKMQESRKKVGIYGTGYITDVFLGACEDITAELINNLVFIDSNKTSGREKYRGRDILNYRDVKYENLSSVIISTEYYIDEILKNIREVSSDILVYILKDL